MKALLAAIAGLVGLTDQAIAEAVPFHRFAFNAEAGYVRYDGPLVGERVLGGAVVHGEVLLVRCEKTDEFDAGFRFKLASADSNKVLYAGFVCDPETGLLQAGFRRGMTTSSGEWISLESENGQTIGRKGDRVALTIHVSGSHMVASFGDYVFERKLEFEPASFHYYGFGTTGVANFYEKSEAMS
ncbi:MAG: hypothetical protein RLO80_06250 [Hyphomonas sp.]